MDTVMLHRFDDVHGRTAVMAYEWVGSTDCINSFGNRGDEGFIKFSPWPIERVYDLNGLCMLRRTSRVPCNHVVDGAIFHCAWDETLYPPEAIETVAIRGVEVAPRIADTL